MTDDLGKEREKRWRAEQYERSLQTGFVRCGPHHACRRDDIYAVDWARAYNSRTREWATPLALQLRSQDQAFIVTRGWERIVLAQIGIDLDEPSLADKPDIAEVPAAVVGLPDDNADDDQPDPEDVH